MILTLIRHGKTKYNLDHRYTPQKLSIPMLDSSIVFLKENKRFYPEVDLVFTSKALRCKKTAEIIYPNKHLIEIPEFREFDFGSFSDCTPDELYNSFFQKKAYRHWLNTGCKGAVPKGDTLHDFKELTLKGMREVIAYCRTDGKSFDYERVAVICHDGTVMTVMSYLTNKDYFDCHINPAGYVSLKLDENLIAEVEDIFDGQN